MKTFFKIVCVGHWTAGQAINHVDVVGSCVQFRNYDGKLRPTLIDVTKHFNHNECIHAIYTLKLNKLGVKNVIKKIIILFSSPP